MNLVYGESIFVIWQYQPSGLSCDLLALSRLHWNENLKAETHPSGEFVMCMKGPGPRDLLEITPQRPLTVLTSVPITLPWSTAKVHKDAVSIWNVEQERP